MAQVSKVASVRKSVLGMLLGKYVVNGTINLQKTVKQLELDDLDKFLPIEEVATLQNLIMSRSGIYLEADPNAPRKGSQAPDALFYYNNWDFNAAGTAFEKLTGQEHFRRTGDRPGASDWHAGLWIARSRRKFRLFPGNSFPSTPNMPCIFRRAT